MKNSTKWIRICSIVCSVLMLALLVFQCLPFWTMPVCDACQVRCELEVNEECEACKAYSDWCAVPTSCVCEYQCSRKNINQECPICTVDKNICVAETPAPPTEPTEAPTEATEPTEVTAPPADTEPTEATEPVENVEATEPAEDAEATEPAEDAEATEPAEDAEATEPAEDAEATEPAEDAEATEPAEDVEVTEPTEPEPEPLPLVPVAPIPEERKIVEVAIQEFVWLPTFEQCDGVQEYFEERYTVGEPGDDDYDPFVLKDVVLMPVVVLIFTIATIVFTVLKSDKPWAVLITLVASVVACIGYQTQPIYQLNEIWTVHMGLAIAALVAAMVGAVLTVIAQVKNKK